MWRHRSENLRRRLQCLPVLGRRGGIAAMLAVSSTVLIGFVGLAVEGGTWYLATRNVSTAVDLAALAGAAALDRGQAAVPVATDTVTRNGYVHGGTNTVTVNSPPLTGAYAGVASAVEVIVTQMQSMGITKMFHAGTATVSRRAVVAANVEVNVCLLALGGGLSLNGHTTINAERCALASNASPLGIFIHGSATVRATDLVTTGTCNGCDSGNVYTDDTSVPRVRPDVVANRPHPVADPYANLQNWTPEPLGACQTVALGGNNKTATISSGTPICSSVSIRPGDTLTLNPGIYYFKDGANLDVQGTINGNGVTLVFTNSNLNNVGTITINATAKGELIGPTGTLIAGHPEAAGLLLYRDGNARNNGAGTNEVHINGGGSMALKGGLYFPTSDVVINGNAGVAATNCRAIVGYRLAFSGTSNTQLNVAGCSGFTTVPTIRVARLVE